MRTRFILPAIIILLSLSVQAQRKRKPQNVDTLVSNYQPADLFSPMFYPERGDEVHGANGEPGPKYWQNLANYNIKASIDTATKTLSAVETIDYINHSPDALQYLWLQLDQNTYKKNARSNFYVDFTGAPAQHTDGYVIESVAFDNGDVVKG
ncbi:MAG: M1 family peptidase, partial [Mucilaginibacter sp.]